MKKILLPLLLSWIIAQEKYPADSLIKSKNTPFFHKVGLLPISGWQRISYNSNFFNCQFYPSCSNYGAIAIKQYGFIRGSIIVTERISRCNPFAIYYHLELNRPFHDNDGRLIDPINQKQISNSKKSPLISVILSAILPGAGKIYSGRTMDGILGLWNVYMCYNSAKFSIKNERPILGPLFGVALGITYLGEIYGAWRSAVYYQKSNDTKT